MRRRCSIQAGRHRSRLRLSRSYRITSRPLEVLILSPTTLLTAFDQVTDHWSPKVIGQVNDQLLKAAKLKGELVWHAHDGQDELFYIVKGSLRMEFEDHVVDLEKGDFLTVSSGVRHNPVAQEECWVLLIELAQTKHTGDEVTSRTRSLEEQYS